MLPDSEMLLPYLFNVPVYVFDLLFVTIIVFLFNRILNFVNEGVVHTT